jgi:prepilin-type N-terminal cleavage/methylation domain-containing protein
MAPRHAVSGLARRGGFTLVELIVAITLLAGVLLGFAYFSQQMLHANQSVTARALASDLVVARLEQIKGTRTYTTLVGTYNNTTETWPAGHENEGYTRQTWVTRTGPTGQHDYITVTVSVTGRGLVNPVRRTTSIAAF